MNNIHGHCPHCNANLDGDLVINYPISQGYTPDLVLEYASSYAGWSEHGEKNRWGRAIALYDMRADRTVAYRCPDCEKTWERE
jgi:hypothetical protein